LKKNQIIYFHLCCQILILLMNQLSNHKEWLVIVNPNAGNSKGRKDWHLISDFMKKARLSFTVKFTEAKGHAVKLTQEAIREGCRNIIVVGGDGTLNEIVNGIFTCRACPSTDISLAMIPVGTGNDWGRMFGIPLDYEKAAEIISEGKMMLHDIGVMTYHQGEEIRKRYFINIAGLGFESVVVRRTNYQKERGYSGKAIYFYNLLISLLTYKNTRAEIIVDGENNSAEVFSINVGNGKYCGGGMRQTPDALPDDGLLDVTVINGIGKIEIILSLKMLYDGTILSHPKIDAYKCKNLKVNSDSVLWAEADGESLGHTPAEFSILPSRINIVYGSKVIR
jgi:diacylglycerol kinase (ATP)